MIALKIKTINFNNKILSVLKVVIPLFSISFFGQIFDCLLSTNRCIKNSAFYDFNQKCENDFLFLFEYIISVIAIIFLCIISLFVVSIYYIPIFIKGKSYIKKISSIPEQIFFITKIVIILLFYIEDILKEKNKYINNYLMVVILVVISGINSYFAIVYKNSENQSILLFNNIMSLLLFWGFSSLLIGYIFKYIDYNGTDYLFIIGSILIIFYQVYYNEIYQDEYLQNINYIYTNQERLNYIIKCIDLIDKRNDSRKNKIILKTLLERVELYCIDQHCPIKQYFHQLKKGIDSSILLYGYIQILFKKNISKDKNDITAKIYHIMFVMTKLNERKNAHILLKKLEDRQMILFQDLFNIYRVRVLMEELSYLPEKEGEKFYNINMLNLVQYKKYIKDFKNILYKTTSLYLNFWTSLLNSQKHIDNIETLYNTGKEIKDLIEKIGEYFNKINNFRNDSKIITLYSNFLKNVLVDKKSYEKYNKTINNINIENKNYNREDDYSNFNINKLKESDQSQWILLSANDKTKGKILNLSLGICPIIGYKRREIIGNNIDILIPNIFHKPHEDMINKLFYDTKYNFYESLSKCIEYKPNYISKTVYCKNKSKFLVPFPFRAFFIQNEEGEHMFIMNILKQQCFPNTKNSNNEELSCCVLTDKNFLIQTFTPNAYDFLGFNSTDIDSGLNITSCINNFGAYFLNNTNDKETVLDNDGFNCSSDLLNETVNKSYTGAKTLKSEGKLKKKITKIGNYQPRLISWRYNHNINELNNNINKNIKVLSRSPGHYEIKINKIETITQEKKLILQIKESKIHNKTIGYKFIFKKIKHENIEILPSRSNYISNIMNLYNNNLIEQSDAIESDISEMSYLNDANNINTFYNATTLKSTRKDSINKIESSLSLFTNVEKPSVNVYKRRHSQGNFRQKININNFVIPFQVDGKTVPRNKCNFYFDLNTKSYIYHDKFKNNYLTDDRVHTEDILVKTLAKESKEKIMHLKTLSHVFSKRNMRNTLVSKSNKSKSSNSSSSSNSENDSVSDDSSSSEENVASLNQEEFRKRYNSFAVKKIHKSQGNLPNMDKYQNKTAQSHFGKKSIKDQPLFEKISNQLKEKNKIDYEEKYQYHEINLKPIRFLKYDFYKETIIEDVFFEKMSKMKKIFHAIKTNDKIINKEDNYPTIDLNNLIKLKKNLENKNESQREKKKKIDKKLDFNKLIINNYKQHTEKKTEKEEKKINEALNKKDKQHSIKKFLLISIISLCVFYTIGGINLYLYLDEIERYKENIKLICDSSELKFYSISEVYIIRELILTNIKNITNIENGEYTGFTSYNKTEFISILINRSLELYSYIHVLNERITSTNLPLSENTTYFLYTKEYTIEALSADFDIIYLRSSLSNALIILDGYLYNLVELTSTIEQNNEDVFPFMFNTLNIVGNLLNIQIELFINELEFRSHNDKIKFILNVCGVFVILAIVCILISKGYSIVLKNKYNYFYIFYSIKIDALRSLINNCEFFLQKLKEDKKILNEEDENENEKNNEKEEDSEILNPKMNLMLASIMTHNNESNTYNYNLLSPGKRKGFINKIISNQYKEGEEKKIHYEINIKIFIICFTIFCLIILLYLFIIFWNYSSILNLISQYAIYINHLQSFHNSIIEIINAYREFLFDQNSIIDGVLSNDYIDNKMDEIFRDKFNDNIIFNRYRGKIPNFVEKYNDFHSKSFCTRRNEYYFKTEEECNLHMQGISTYGLNVLYTSISEEIRTFKNLVNQLLLENSIVGNLTLYGSKYWNEKEIINEMNTRNGTRLFYRLFLFNNNSYHKDINLLFINAIYPYINEEIEITIDAINDAIKDKGSTIIIFFTCYLSAITLLFILYWIPMINDMNLTFYKTKKMLSIIPLHILASQTNINTILNINDNNTKSNNANK